MALKGIVIDPGHGGVDGGAVGNGIIEKDLNLLISKYMYDRFIELGIPATLTRTEDETLESSARVERILNAYGNTTDVLVISNHINAGGGDGAEVIYALRNTDEFASIIAEEIQKEGQNYRKSYQQRLPSDPSLDYYFIHRETPNTEAVIVEYGFLDSPADDVEQLKNNYEKYAEAVVRAVFDYKNLSYEALPGSGYYTVVKGDSLWSIATKYGVTVAELKELNNLTSDLINVGDTLKVKETDDIGTEDYYIYTVQSGDSLWSIANKYDTTVDVLKSINNLTTTTLQINQQLFVPTKVEVDEEVGDYIVQSGDTLYSIANKYNVTVSELKSTNNLSSDTLFIGQTLKMPGITDTPLTEENVMYVVVSGDSLWSIANKYNVSIDDIKSNNNLTTDVLQIGQILYIPGTTNYATYTVVSGDTLWDIAVKYNVTVSDLMKTNNLTNSNLSIGQKLIIPTK